MNYLNSKIITLIFLAVILIILSTAVSAEELNDLAGRKLKLPEKIERIVAVGPGALRLVVYLEAENRVVGIEEFEKRNQKRPYILGSPELLELPVIGPQFGGDAELIAAQNPDIIISSYLSSAQIKNLQSKTKTPVVSLTDSGAGSMTEENFKKAINFLGGVLNKNNRARELINYFDKQKGELKDRIKNKNKKRVYIGGIGNKGAKGITSTEAGYPPFRYLELNNIIESENKRNFSINKEKLLLADPELIFIDQGGLELVESDLKRKEFNYLKAYQRENIYELLPYNHYSTNFATMLADAYYIGKITYSEEFSDLKVAAKADQIYKKFVGKSVYKKMADIFGGFKKMKLNN